MIECPGCSSSSLLTELENLSVADIRCRLHACGSCGLHFWEPRVMPDPSFYETVQEGESKARLLRHALTDYELRPYHRQFFADPPPPGRLLDIGCGDGKFLEAAKGKGFEVWGLDLDSRSIEVATERGLDKVFACTLDQFAGKNPPLFDVITIFEVLEHQAEPAAFMGELGSLVAPGGYLCGSVPNRRRWKNDQDDRWDSPPHHFTRWTEDSLRLFLSRQGFGEIAICNVSFGYRVMARYGAVAAFFKRRSFHGLSERDLLLYPLERLEKDRKISGTKSAALMGAKRTVKGLLSPLLMLEGAVERLTGRGQTLVFKCRKV